MTENLMEVTTHLIERYLEILEDHGEPNEGYKYLAINTFQDNWDIEAENFHQMFRASFSKVSNLLYQNSWGFIDKASQLFPEEVREMFSNLYDETADIFLRIRNFQFQSESLLPKVQQALKRTNINAQQDERTISVYLAFRFPENYILYKADYYRNFCEKLNLETIEKPGQRFMHLQRLGTEIIELDLLNNENFLNKYRQLYPKQEWNDNYLMIQNILYVVFRNDKEFKLLDYLKNFDKNSLEEYYAFLDSIIEYFDLQENDQRLVFNIRKKWLVFTIGQRYIWLVSNNNGESIYYGAISPQITTSKYTLFSGLPQAFWNETTDLNDILQNKKHIFDAIEIELNRTQTSGYIKYNKDELERMAFDIDFRNKILKRLEFQKKPSTEMDNGDSTKSIPLNQILFGAPGTGKTYNTKRIAVEIINGRKERTRELIASEYEDLVDAKQIVFTTFHQSLSYEDFIEGIKPETIRGDVTYEVKDGIFKDICNNANDSLAVKNISQFTMDGFKEYLERLESMSEKSQKDYYRYINVLLNKEKISTKKCAFEDIPKYNNLHEIIEDKDSIDQFDKEFGFRNWFITSVNHLIRFQNSLGSKGTAGSTKNYVIIIDEINRGNVSAIFGELITLIEESKRAGNDDALEAVLPYSKEKFSVPNNVYIIGTMNTADRSVEALDTALRRRFSFIEMQPKPQVLEKSSFQDVDLKQLLEIINQRIEVLVDKDHQIGHSYFLGIQNLDDLKRVFKDKIIPLLEEYFYGDFGKIGLVLGGKFIYQEQNIAKFPTNYSYENDFLEEKKVYRVSSSENWDKEAFISVYQD